MRNFYPSPRRDPIKNYFPLPNEIFALGLSAGEIAVYAYLLYREDRKTFRCYPSYKTIGKAIGVSRNTVKKYVDGLITYTDDQGVHRNIVQYEPKNGKMRGHRDQLDVAIRGAVMTGVNQLNSKYREQRAWTTWRRTLWRPRPTWGRETWMGQTGGKITPLGKVRSTGGRDTVGMRKSQ